MDVIDPNHQPQYKKIQKSENALYIRLRACDIIHTGTRAHAHEHCVPLGWPRTCVSAVGGRPIYGSSELRLPVGRAVAPLYITDKHYIYYRSLAVRYDVVTDLFMCV